MPLAVSKEETLSLAQQRAITDERTKRDRLAAAVKALADCGLTELGEALSEDWGGAMMRCARDGVQATRLRVIDGSDPAMFAACNVALGALGRLWAVS